MWKVICDYRSYCALLGLLFLLLASQLQAHEVRPAYLELKQTAPETFDVFWKVPGRDDMRLSLYVKVPQNCKPVSLQNQYSTGDAFIERWILKCDGGLAGKTIAIEGLAATITDVLVRMERLDGTMQATRLTAGRPSFVVDTSPHAFQVAITYGRLGIEHILTGIDHLLFILALIIITNGGWKLVKTVTAFTISHSITLTAATLGFVHVPQRPVEAVIALSIVFVAAEILHARQGREGIAARAPWAVALTFGLLHGLGFASGLSSAGLPQAHIPVALLFFSMGVELGHFLFVGFVISLIALLRHPKLTIPQWAKLIPPYAIGSIAMFWVIQRIAAF
jgi:hydrogenase/urease accessory protein HupE